MAIMERIFSGKVTLAPRAIEKIESTNCIVSLTTLPKFSAFCRRLNDGFINLGIANKCGKLFY